MEKGQHFDSLVQNSIYQIEIREFLQACGNFFVFLFEGFRKLANVLKIWQKMKTICHEFLGGSCYRLWNQFELRNTGYFTTNPQS